MRNFTSVKQRWLLFTACGLIGALIPAHHALAQASTTTTTTTSTSAHAEEITVKAAKRLLKEKNSPSAVTELGKEAIASAGVAGSPGTLLRQVPSTYVYSQGLGDNAPEFSIRGLRGLEIATTLDGVPTQDLEAPGASYLANNIGGVFTLSQISSVSVYPGVAYPDKNTFGTIGGTIAYDSKRPTDDYYVEAMGSVGSFGTYKEGIELNSGRVDSPLGTGDNAAKVLLSYTNFQTQGFIDATWNRENEVEFAFDKPYNDGLSKFQATVLYNTGNGLIENEPVPAPYLNLNGAFSNYPSNLEFAHERNDYLTVILKDQQYVNDWVTANLTGFYLGNDNQLETYGAPGLFLPGQQAFNSPLAAGNSTPFINNPAGFGEGGLYGPPVGGGGFGIFSGAPGAYGGYFYGGGNHYNPAQYYNNPAACPANIIAAYGDAGNSPCGLNDQITGGHSDTYGIQPSVLITPPDIFGIANTLKIGGMIAKETSPTGYAYLGAFPGTPKDAANSAAVRTGGTQRTIYQLYVQDKIDLLDNTVHITPGGTLEASFASYLNDFAFGSHLAPIFGPDGAEGPNGAFTTGGSGSNIDQYGYYKATRFDREFLPFLNISYDLDKVFPVLKGTSLYGSVGNSALFAPVGDFGPNTAGPPPSASIVHLYEGGVRYNISTVSFQADYFYQKVDRDFGFFQFQSGPQNGQSVYSNFGRRETKGFEAQVKWQVTPEWQLFGNASYTRAHYLTTGAAFDTVAEDQFGTAFRGTPETGIPQVLSNFGVQYETKSLARDGDDLGVRFYGTYTGHQSTTYDLGPNDYLNVPNYPGLAALDYTGCGVVNPQTGNAGTCLAYTRYNQITGATTYDPHGGINPFTIFNLDVNYTLPTPMLPVLKKLTFDMNIQNLFNKFYYQYFYKQISPSSCGTFTSGPFYVPGLPASQQLTRNNYSCTPEFSDFIPGQPFSIFFTVKARF